MPSRSNPALENAKYHIKSAVENCYQELLSHWRSNPSDIPEEVLTRLWRELFPEALEKARTQFGRQRRETEMNINCDALDAKHKKG